MKLIPKLTEENRDEWLLTEEERDVAVKKFIDVMRGDMPLKKLSKQTIRLLSYDAIAGAEFDKISGKVNKRVFSCIDCLKEMEN